MTEEKNNTVPITFTYGNSGQKIVIQATCGTSVLSAAKQNNINIRGFCKGKLKCATCHVYIKNEEQLQSLPKVSPAEQETLKKAAEKKDCSRLCCQLIIDEQNFNNIEFTIPESGPLYTIFTKAVSYIKQFKFINN